LAAFEATFNGPSLFDRLPEGLHLNAAGEQLVAAAESVENAMLTLERRRAAASLVLSGTARLDRPVCRRVSGSLPVGTCGGALTRRRSREGRLQRVFHTD